MTAELIRELRRLASTDPNGDGSAAISITVAPAVLGGRAQITAIVGLANGYTAAVFRNTDDGDDVLREVERKARAGIGT